MIKENIPPHVIKALHRALRIIQDAHDKGAGRDNWLGRQHVDADETVALEKILAGLLHFDQVAADVAKGLQDDADACFLFEALHGYNHGADVPAVAVGMLKQCVDAGVAFDDVARQDGRPFAVFHSMPANVPDGVLIVVN